MDILAAKYVILPPQSTTMVPINIKSRKSLPADQDFPFSPAYISKQLGQNGKGAIVHLLTS
jgi:hypothetical protein